MPYLCGFSLRFVCNESAKIRAVFPTMAQNTDKKENKFNFSA